MLKIHRKTKKFKVYYFTGDYFSAKGERRHYCIIEAEIEYDAEIIFKNLYPDRNFGWIDEI